MERGREKRKMEGERVSIVREERGGEVNGFLKLLALPRAYPVLLGKGGDS